VLEDLHWLDEASEQVLRDVLVDVPGLRLLVLVAQRPGWNPPWSEWGWVERLTLRALQEEDAALLAGSVLGGTGLSGELLHYVAERAGGNPFFVEEMLRALQEGGNLIERDGAMVLVAGAAERLPSTLTEVLQARLDQLDGDVRSVAQVASVIGRSFGIRLLAEVVGEEQAMLETPLAALQLAEIAFPRQGSNLEYVFKHVSMREAAYNTLLQRRRRELHLKTARAIALLYPSDEYVEMIAYHSARTEEHGEAAEWLEKAGDQAASVYANEIAIGDYREARRRLELIEADGSALARLDEKLGRSLYTASRLDEAVESLSRSVDAYRESRDPKGARRATALLGGAHHRQGNSQEALAEIQTMIDLLSWSGPSRALSSLNMTLTRILQSLGRGEEMLAAAERAGEIAQAIGDDVLLAEAGERRGTALTILGKAEQARLALEEAIPKLEAAGGEPRVLSSALTNLGESHRMAGELEQAKRYNERALEVAQRTGNPGQVGFDLMNLAQIVLCMGSFDEAWEDLRRGEEMFDSAGADKQSIYIPAIRGQVLLARGDWDGAAGYLAQALAESEAVEDRQALELIHVSLAELDVVRGQPEAAIGRLQPLATRQGGFTVSIRLILAWAYLERGDVAQAAALARDAVEVARAQQERLSLVDALRVQGMVLSRQEHWDEAERAFREGLELAHPMPYPYAEARILTEMGMLETVQNNAEQARDQLGEALAIFRQIGATKDIEKTAALLSRLA